jgi:hypothetical protein
MGATSGLTQKVGYLSPINFMLRALLCCLVIGACAKQENPTPIADARNIRASEAISPAKCFRMTGEITFRNVGYTDIVQHGELWLGGNDRMRFSIGTKDKKNIFLLDGENGCWKKTPGNEFIDYPQSRETFSTETALRWYVLRMPWDKDDIRFSYELNEQDLPSKVVFDDMSIQLSDYKPLGKKGTLYPTVWHWTSPDGERVETFNDLQDGALFLDSAFVPPNFNPLDSIRLAHADAESLADRVGIVNENFFYLDEADFTRHSELPKGWWWTSDSKRYFVFEQQPDFQIKNMRSITGKTWMRWATYNKVGDAFGSAQLLKIVEQTGHRNTGGVWAKEIKNNSRKQLKVFLVPVVKD